MRAACSLRAMRGGARERAADAYRPYQAVPQLPAQCNTCHRWLDRSRMCVMPIGAEDRCALCSHLCEALGRVTTSAISEEDEAVALVLVSHIHRLLQGTL